MKRVILPIIAALSALSSLVQVNSAYGNPQAVHERNTVMKDLRKICTPQGSPSGEVWGKTIMAGTRNQQHIREVILAIQRNNQNNYWETLSGVECSDLQAFG